MVARKFTDSLQLSREKSHFQAAQGQRTKRALIARLARHINFRGEYNLHRDSLISMSESEPQDGGKAVLRVSHGESGYCSSSPTSWHR
jgi:hypothetical protein